MIRQYCVFILSLILTLLGVAGLDHNNAAKASAIISSLPVAAAPHKSQVSSGDEPVSTMVILCPLEEGGYLESRANLLQLAPTQDSKTLSFAITSAHGLVNERGTILSDCTLHSTSQKTYAVYGMRLAKGYIKGTPTDWAILAIEPVTDTRLIHYALPDRLSVSSYNALAGDALPVTFPRGRGILHSEQNCVLVKREVAGFEGPQYEGFLSHTCRSVAGQSGSPIAVSRNGVDVLLGVHIGNSLALKTPTITPPRYYGYFRVLDEDSVAQIMSMTLDMQTAVKPTE